MFWRPVSTGVSSDHRVGQPDVESPTRSRASWRSNQTRGLRTGPATAPRAHRCDLAQRNQRPAWPSPIAHRLRPLTPWNQSSRLRSQRIRTKNFGGYDERGRIIFSRGATIEQIASGLAGRIGYAAQEIGGDEVIAFNGDETFVMASTYKVAIATTVLDRVDGGN